MGMVDYHSHLLPGVDDGVTTFDESMNVLKEYEKLGLKGLYLTPHIMEDYRDNCAENLKERFDEYRKQYTGSIKLHIAAEYMFDYSFWKRLKEDKPLTIGKHSILLEFPFSNGITDIKRRLIQVQELGYSIILAHPERYSFLNIEDYRILKSAGIYFQLNLFSLLGAYGAEARQQAKNLLNHNFYNYIGSDIHSYDAFMNYIKVKALSFKLIDQLELIKAYST